MSYHYTVISKSVLHRLIDAADQYRWTKLGRADPLQWSQDRGKLASALRKALEAQRAKGVPSLNPQQKVNRK